MKLINYIALTIAIIGALNWGLVGVLSFDLVAFIFGEMSWLSRIVYTLVGLSGIYLITFYSYILFHSIFVKEERLTSYLIKQQYSANFLLVVEQIWNIESLCLLNAVIDRQSLAEHIRAYDRPFSRNIPVVFKI